MPDLAESLVLQFDNYLLDRPADVLLRLEPDGRTSRVRRHDLITELSRYAGLRPTARSSAFSYKGNAVDLKCMGRNSGSADAVEESPRRQQGGLVINVSIGLGRSWRTTLGRAAL